MHDTDATALASRPTSVVTPQFLLRVGHAAALTLVLQVGGAGLLYILQIAFARWMGATQFGKYAYIVAWTTLLALPAGLGFPNAILRFVPEYRTSGDRARLAGVIRVSRLVTLVGGIAIGAGAALIALTAFGTKLGGDFTLVILGACVVPLAALVNLDSAILRGAGRVASAFGPSLVLRPALMLALAAAIWLAGSPIDASDGIVIMLVVLVVVVLLQALLLRRSVVSDASPTPAIYDTRKWLRVSTPLFFVASFLIALNQTDLILVGAIRGVRDAGIYLAASKTAAIVGYVVTAICAITVPLFSELYARGDREGLQRLVAVSVQAAFWPTLLIAVVLIFIGPEILSLFGPGFARGRWALTVLLVGQLINVAAGTVGYLLTMTGHQNVVAAVYGISTMINVALCALGAYYFGLVGAACGTALTLLMWNVWLHELTRRRLGIHASVISSFRMLRHETLHRNLFLGLRQR